MQINLHLSIDSSKIAHWAAASLTMSGLGWDVQTPEAIESLMATNASFCRRMVSLYLAAHGAPASAQPAKKNRL